MHFKTQIGSKIYLWCDKHLSLLGRVPEGVFDEVFTKNIDNPLHHFKSAYVQAINRILKGWSRNKLSPFKTYIKTMLLD